MGRLTEMLEQLTDAERADLGAANSRYDVGCKALRIIDAHAARVAALVARVAELERDRNQLRRYGALVRESFRRVRRERDEARAERDEWRCARDTHEQNWLNEAARADGLEADRAALVADQDGWQQVSRDWRYRAEMVEAELCRQKEDRAALVAQAALLLRERDEARAPSGGDWHPDQLSSAQEEYIQVRNTLAEIEASHAVALERIQSLESNYNTAMEAWNAEIEERKLQAYNRGLAEARVTRLTEALEAEKDASAPGVKAECTYTATSFCGDTGCETHGIGTGPITHAPSLLDE